MSNPGDLALVSLTLSRGFAGFYPRGTSKECILLQHHQAAGTQRVFPTPMGTAPCSSFPRGGSGHGHRPHAPPGAFC